MGFVMPHITILVAGGAMALALIFQIVGLATVGWIVIDKSSFSSEAGLWEICGSILNRRECKEIENPADWFDACRAFGILGVLAMAASLAFALLICFMNEMKIFFLAAPAAAAAGALCSLIEFAVFAGEASDSSEYFGYSFALTVVAFVLCLVAAALFFLGRSRTE